MRSQPHRRQALELVARVINTPTLLALVIFAPCSVLAQEFPAKAIRIVAATTAGSGHDSVARLVAQGLSERVQQPVVVEPRPGAANMIAAELVAKSAPDGYTLYMPAPTFITAPLLYQKAPYDALRDFAPVTNVVHQPSVLVAHTAFPAKSVKELVALAKQKPQEILFASSGAGGFQHLAVEVFLMMTGTRMTHVPYKGSGPGVIDLLGGRVAVMAPAILGGAPHVRSGKLRALGVTGAKRSAALNDVPTIAEAGVPGYDVTQWWGIVAPARTPKDVISRLNKEFAAVLAVSETKERLARDGCEVGSNSPEEFGDYLRAERDKWAKVIKSAGIKLE